MDKFTRTTVSRRNRIRFCVQMRPRGVVSGRRRLQMDRQRQRERRPRRDFVEQTRWGRMWRCLQFSRFVLGVGFRNLNEPFAKWLIVAEEE